MTQRPFEMILQEMDRQRFAGPFKVRGSLRRVIASVKASIEGAPHLRTTICTHEGHVIRELATDVHGRPYFE